MRKLLFILVLISSTALNAQTQSIHRDALATLYPLNDSILLQKLSAYKYNHLSFGEEISLNRKFNHLNSLNNISAAPSYHNFNNDFVNSDISKNNNNIFNNQGYGMYSKFETGMMYSNDKKTLTVMGTMIFGVMSSMYSDKQSQSNSSKQ